MDNIKFGEFIVKLRKEKNMTQKELAEKLNLTDKAISKWERGLSFPDIIMLKPLSELFDVSIIELLNGERENESEEKIDLDTRILTILKQNEYEKNRKIRKVVRISFLTIITFIIIFFTFVFSKEVLHTYNPVRAIVGYIQVKHFDRQYVEVSGIPRKTIYANSDFDFEKYMNDEGYTKLEGYSIKAGDDWYWNREERVFVEKWIRRGIVIYEWKVEQLYSKQQKELDDEKYNIEQNSFVNKEKDVTVLNLIIDEEIQMLDLNVIKGTNVMEE